MSAKIIDGKETAKTILAELADRVTLLRTKGITPCLAAVLVGVDPASMVYVSMKTKRAESVGIQSKTIHLPENLTQNELLDLIDNLNSDPAVSAILLQHPLPKHIDENQALLRIKPEKDADGISPLSLAALMTDMPGFKSATPLGIITLLERYNIPIEGKNAVVIGRSVILGKPAALMLLQKNATVTICHSRTKNLSDIVRSADILVSAIGKPEFVQGDWIKPGAVVIDAGYSRVEGRKGDVGDVHYESAVEVADWITPVPGGVGPMTIAMLLSNTVTAAELSQTDTK